MTTIKCSRLAMPAILCAALLAVAGCQNSASNDGKKLAQRAALEAAGKDYRERYRRGDKKSPYDEGARVIRDTDEFIQHIESCYAAGGRETTGEQKLRQLALPKHEGHANTGGGGGGGC